MGIGSFNLVSAPQKQSQPLGLNFVAVLQLNLGN